LAVQRSQVLVVDDHRAFAGALAARLSAEPDVHVVAAVVGCAEALATLAAEHVDLALVDLTLGADDGLELVRAMRDRQPDLVVVMVTEVDDDAAATAAVRFGVSGWVLKHAPVEDLLRVLRGVLAGESWYPPRMLTGVLHRLVRPADEDGALGRLTPREREVLACMVDGLDRQGIAERLYLSSNTVRTHVQNMLSKLEVHSGLEAVAVAVRAGLR